MKKICAWLCVVALAVRMLNGCGGKKRGENGEVNIYVWTEYVQDSGMKHFEYAYGIKINVTHF